MPMPNRFLAFILEFLGFFLVFYRNLEYDLVFWYLFSNFLVFSWYFIGILSTTLLKVGFILVFFGRIKIGLVFGFCGCHFIDIGLVSV